MTPRPAPDPREPDHSRVRRVVCGVCRGARYIKPACAFGGDLPAIATEPGARPCYACEDGYVDRD